MAQLPQPREIAEWLREHDNPDWIGQYTWNYCAKQIGEYDDINVVMYHYKVHMPPIESMCIAYALGAMMAERER